MATIQVINDRQCNISQQYQSMKIITNGLYKQYLSIKTNESLTVQDQSNIKRCTEYIFEYIYTCKSHFQYMFYFISMKYNSFHLIYSYIPQNCINCSHDHSKVKKFKNCYLKELDETTFSIADYPFITNQVLVNYIVQTDVNDKCSSCNKSIPPKEIPYVEKCESCNKTYCKKCTKSDWQENVRSNRECIYFYI